MTVEQIEERARFEARKHDIAADIRQTLDRARQELAGNWEEIEAEILALVTEDE